VVEVEVVEVAAVEVGEVAVFGASAPLLLETDVLRVGSWTSLPDWNMKRRSCHVGEDMMVVDDCLVSGGWLELCFEVCLKCWRGRKGIVSLSCAQGVRSILFSQVKKPQCYKPEVLSVTEYHVVQSSCRDAKCNDMRTKFFTSFRVTPETT
jgi:hypothetical protein